jgi:hypothetical protein
MPTQPPPTYQAASDRPVDLLIVGGLTVDRFADGTSAPGGTVLHGSRAAAAAGLRTASVAFAGTEPEALIGLEELAPLGPMTTARVPVSITFLHAGDAADRRLTLLSTVAPITVGQAPVAPRAVLYGPVAGELDARLGGQQYPTASRTAVLQGWLRTLHPGLVETLPLSSLDPGLVDQLGGMDALIASEEDLSAVASRPDEQLAALRQLVGGKPVLAITGGARGAWLSAAESEPIHVGPPRIVSGIATTGAGDAFAAIFAAQLGRRRPIRDAAEEAAAAAVAYLERPPRF